jgi:hypothetical protein
VQNVDLQPKGTRFTNYIAVGKIGIHPGNNRYWLYATGEPKIKEFPHTSLFPTKSSRLALAFLRELKEKYDIEGATSLIDDAVYLQTVLSRLELRFHIHR